MANAAQLVLDPSALAAFAASMGTLPRDEVRKAKSLFIRNAIADYRLIAKTSRAFLIVIGIMCIIPIFLIVFIPAVIQYRAARQNLKQKIRNALAVWKDDLGPEYDELTRTLDAA